jgi:hypothetical protein
LEAEPHPAEGQLLEKQLNIEQLRMFRAGARIPTISRTEGQQSASLKTKQPRDNWYAVSVNVIFLVNYHNDIEYFEKI